MLIDTHFQCKDIIIFLFGLGFVFSSIIFYLKKRIKLSILLLSIGGFILRFFIIRLDPFIYTWDEEFHALVAKNMMTNPFKPMLYVNPVLPYDINCWVANHIWLHKGPTFLWLIAISFKIFGINEIAIRIPSILLSTLMIPMLFRMGRLIINEKIGYFTCFLFATANYQLEMCTGLIGSDHNDVAFMFFICASFWALFEYLNSKKEWWIILVGLFSGLAVDTKWIMGFLVFFCWLLMIILNKNKRKDFSYYTVFIKAALGAFLISLAWYLYAFIRFPNEMLGNLKLYSQHFSSVIENHSGGRSYYIDLLNIQYGWITPFIILISFYFLYKKLEKKEDLKTLLIVWLLSVHIFYAIARTKMPLFTIIAAPVIYFSLGNFMVIVIEYLTLVIEKYQIILFFLLIAFTGYFNIGINEIEGQHTDMGFMRVKRANYIHNSIIFKELAIKFPKKDYVIFNCKYSNDIQVMFYSGMTAYNELPDSTTLMNLKKDGIKLAVFNDGKIPKFILDDDKIIKINYCPL